jgi:hypothetical protein
VNAGARAREFFLREAAMRRSDEFAPAQLAAIHLYKKAAMMRLRAAKDLWGVGQGSSTLPLFQQAAHLLILAFLGSKGDPADPSKLGIEAALDRLEAVLAEEGISSPTALASTRALLLSTDPLALDRLPGAEAESATSQLQSVVEWLVSLVDLRSPKELKIQRLLRLSTAAAALLAGLVWLGVKLFSPPNLALHRPVTATATAYDTTPAGVVDGDRSTSFGYHSAEDDAPWLAIDLGQSIRIDKVKVYGRSDCCFDQSIPISLEISDDGVTYREVAARSEKFSDYDPWVVTPGQMGRYVRLRVHRRTYLVLNEVEVYGRKAG